MANIINSDMKPRTQKINTWICLGWSVINLGTANKLRYLNQPQLKVEGVKFAMEATITVL